MSAVTKRIDRIQAVASTWGAYLHEQRDGDKVVSDPTPRTRAVWVVAVGGDFRPPHSRVGTYDWGVMVFDATTGQWLRTDAGPGAWPSFLD